MDAGKPSAEAVAELSAEYPEHAAWIRAYWDRWPETLAGLVPGTADLLAELAAAGRDLYAITNFTGEVWPVTLDTFPVLSQFKDIIVSSFEGVYQARSGDLRAGAAPVRGRPGRLPVHRRRRGQRGRGPRGRPGRRPVHLGGRPATAPPGLIG